jgi:hypothetical protein
MEARSRTCSQYCCILQRKIPHQFSIHNQTHLDPVAMATHVFAHAMHALLPHSLTAFRYFAN